MSVGSKTLGNMNCAVCSIINFDSIIKDDENLKQNQISYEQFYSTSLNSIKSGGENYLHYLYGVNDISKFSLKNPDEFFDFEKQYIVLTGIAEEGALKSTQNFIFESVDAFNDFFFSFLGLSKIKDDKKYGPMPVRIVEKSKLDDIGCDNFITKS